MDKEAIKNEISRFMRHTTPIQDDTPKKSKINLPRILLFSYAGILFLGLTVTFIPDQKPVVVYQIQDNIAYPINQKGTKITVRTLESGENFPEIKIGPGCSMARRQKTNEKYTIPKSMSSEEAI